MTDNDRARRRRVAGRGGDRTRLRRSAQGVLSVQLLPQFLADGDLPPLVVGEAVEAAPAIYAGTVDQGGRGRGLSVDECGCIDATGEILTAMLEPGSCDCRVDVLDADGVLLPLNWATTDPVSGDVHVEGGLYLDPGLEPDTPYGAAIALCRRRYEVRAVRRYVWNGRAPAFPVSLGAAPSPSETSERAVYVADLVALPGVAPDDLIAVPSPS